MNGLDLVIMEWLRQMMHTFLPFTNSGISGFPIGEYMFYGLAVYVAGEIYLIKTGNWGKKKVKR